MINADEYAKLLPHREKLMAGNAGKPLLIILNEILVRLNYGPICFDCSGSIARAVQDGQGLITEYEKSVKIG
jgi:hypothetical protein